MKRFLTTLVTVLVLTAALAVTASASTYDAAAEDLSKIGMFRGTEQGFELDRAPTRSEAAIMLVRLYGAEEKAAEDYAAGTISHPFTDVSDSVAPYVAWLYTNGITKGTTETTFTSRASCGSQQYVVFLLRALNSRRYMHIQFGAPKLVLNLVVLLAQAVLMILDVPYWWLWEILLTLLMFVCNIRQILQTLQRILGRRRPQSSHS